jgi:REP element-mobilizing transposase RayT
MFGWVTQTGVELSALGHIVHESWVAIERHFARVNLHGFVIMPNHVHGIIEIASTGLAQHAVPLQRRLPIQILPNPSSLSVIVRSFKAEVTRRGRLELHWKGEVWQRNYYDRVLRDGQEYSDASRYVAENPVRWRSFQAMPTKGKKDAERLAQHAVPLQRSDG